MKLTVSLLWGLCLFGLFIGLQTVSGAGELPKPGKPLRFEVGANDFLIEGQKLQIRCGEIHFARVPREYWQQRLRLCHAMGLNTVCAYLFWNYHEWEEGKYDWSGQRDAAEFCRLAQQEGLWVILRPGPYACAEWEMGGLPWWLLKKEDIQLRSRDTYYLEKCNQWLKEVGRVLGPLQVDKGGPILMVQAENEYGFYGEDKQYMGEIRQALLNAGFTVPLFDCNPTYRLNVAKRDDLFHVVNFGNNPADGFKALREIQPTGPLMCGEFYPGWFDTWGQPHHTGNTTQYLTDLDYMLKNNGSFSIYMAHGGTTFGLWAGCDRPFKPDTTSYDYDAPISEAGWVGEKFQQTRTLMQKYLLPGETLPEPPAAMPVMELPPFTLTETAELFANLPQPIKDETPRNMEAYNQSRGVMVYRTTLAAGPAAMLEAKQVRDFAWVFIDGTPVGSMDARSNRFKVTLPARDKAARLDILLYTIGRVNFGVEVHNRKGVQGPVTITAAGQAASELKGWEVYCLNLGDEAPTGLQWQKGPAKGPSFWRGSFTATTAADTFFDVSRWGKGVVWINGRCLGRFWNIGPTQTMYLPGPWLKAGVNEIVVLDLLGPQDPVIAGVKVPVLNQLRPELDFARKGYDVQLTLESIKPVKEGSFPPGPAAQDIRFAAPVTGRYFCLESLNAHDGKAYAAAAEIDLLDEQGQSISHALWTIAYADSEESVKEDGSALNVINGQTADFWHTEWGVDPAPKHPHYVVIDLGASTRIGGMRFTPRPGGNNQGGRIKDYRVYVGDKLVKAKDWS